MEEMASAQHPLSMDIQDVMEEKNELCERADDVKKITTEDGNKDLAIGNKPHIFFSGLNFCAFFF